MRFRKSMSGMVSKRFPPRQNLEIVKEQSSSLLSNS
jgi:hypothetical protein